MTPGSDILEVPTNGKVRVPWGVIVAVLWGLFLGLLTWTAQRELNRNEARLEVLEQRDAEKENAITVLRTLRPEDRQLIEEIRQQLSEQGQILNDQGNLLAQIAARVGVREAHR